MKTGAIIFGLSVSAAAHAAVIAVFHLAGMKGEEAAAPAPELLIARGAPIQVRLSEAASESREPMLSASPLPISQTDSALAAEAMDVDTPLWNCWTTAMQIAALTSTAIVLSPVRDAEVQVSNLEPVTWRDALTSSASPRTMPLPAAPVRPIGATLPDMTARVTPANPAMTSTTVPVPPLEEAPNTSLAGVQQGAERTYAPQPVYPERAIRLGQQGEVLVLIEVRADGSVGAVTIHTSSGHRLLDRAALAAARECRFRPAMRGGRDVASTVLVPFEFHLDDA